MFGERVAAVDKHLTRSYNTVTTVRYKDSDDITYYIMTHPCKFPQDPLEDRILAFTWKASED